MFAATPPVLLNYSRYILIDHAIDAAFLAYCRAGVFLVYFHSFSGLDRDGPDSAEGSSISPHIWICGI